MKKTPKKDREAKNFYNALKDNPEAIIAWCEKEIAEYQALIALIKKKKSK